MTRHDLDLAVKCDGLAAAAVTTLAPNLMPHGFANRLTMRRRFQPPVRDSFSSPIHSGFCRTPHAWQRCQIIVNRGRGHHQSRTIAAGALRGYIPRTRFEKVWVEQCRATKAIKRHFGAKSALDCLVGEKLLSFADAARDHPAFSRELPKFLAAVWHTFNEYEIAGYVATRKPASRSRLRQLLFLR